MDGWVGWFTFLPLFVGGDDLVDHLGLVEPLLGILPDLVGVSSLLLPKQIDVQSHPEKSLKKESAFTRVSQPKKQIPNCLSVYRYFALCLLYRLDLKSKQLLKAYLAESLDD